MYVVRLPDGSYVETERYEDAEDIVDDRGGDIFVPENPSMFAHPRIRTDAEYAHLSGAWFFATERSRSLFQLLHESFHGADGTINDERMGRLGMAYGDACRCAGTLMSWMQEAPVPGYDLARATDGDRP